MPKLIIFILVLFFIVPESQASSINPAAYRTMQMQSYSNNYRRNARGQVIPYWRAQSNYATRNRVYRNYAQYDNTVQQYNAVQSSRRSR